MKDVHNHILYGIDDGSDNLEESIKIIENAFDNGYTDLILTPHFRMDQNYICNNQDKKIYLKIIEEEVKKRNIKVNLYLGNEITVDDNFFKYLETNQICSLCNSRYLLLELPFFEVLNNLDKIIKKIIELGFIPIIAHPERNMGYKIEDFEEMLRKGVLLQGDSGSLFGKYGDKSKEKLENMLKRHMIHFIGSDIHHDSSRGYDRTENIVNRLKELTRSETITEDLVDKNIQKIIDNEKITAYPIRKIRYRFKYRLKKKIKLGGIDR